MSHYQNDIQSHARPGAGKPAMAIKVRPHPQRRNEAWAPVSAHEAGTGADAHQRPSHDLSQRVARVGIIGATATGMGIARDLLDADIPVTVYEPAREALDTATASVRSACEASRVAGELTAAQRDRRVALLAGTINLHHLKDCDVIVDAMGAGTDVASGLVRRLNELAKPGAILMACAASCDIDQVASLARYPENVLGFHVSDAGATQVWEFVPAKPTSASTVATAAALVQALRRPPQEPATHTNA